MHALGDKRLADSDCILSHHQPPAHAYYEQSSHRQITLLDGDTSQAENTTADR